MKLYMIVYIAGKVAGFTGPLDYGMVECQHRAALQNAACVNGTIKCQDILQVCEWSVGQPTIDPSYIN